MEAVIRDRVVTPTKDSPVSWRVPCHAFCGLEDDVVPEASARGCFDSVKPVPGNHFTILRPPDHKDPRYSELAELLLDPGGHVHRFDIELYETRLQVEPHDPAEPIRVGESRTVYSDNRARLMRNVRFSSANRCHDSFTIRYATRSGGCIFPQTSHANEAAHAEVGRWEDEGTYFPFVFTPDGQDDYWLDLEIYKGFDPGHRDIHFHLGNDSFYRELLYVVDVSSYLDAGYKVTSTPHMYFHAGDQGHTGLCRNRNPRDLVGPDPELSTAGQWCFRLQNIRSGIVDIVFDVAAVTAQPAPTVEDETWAIS